jgi:hypothetical protein
MGALALGTLVIIIGGLLYVKRKSLEFLYNRTYWAIGALVSLRRNRLDYIKIPRIRTYDFTAQGPVV